MGQRVAINGHVLAELRILRRLTQEGLRDRCQERDPHCGLTTERISEYERGIRQPTWPNLLALADALELNDDEWRALIHTPTLDAHTTTTTGEDEKLDRRTLSKAIGAGLGGLVVPPAALDTLQSAAERIAAQDRIDAALITDHEQLADAYALLDRAIRPARLLSPVTDQADTLYGLLDQPAPPKLQDRLYVVAAGTHAQAGKLAWIAGDRTNARRYFALATDIAEDSRNDTLRAQILGVASTAHRQPGGRAAAMMAQAVALAAHADGNTQAWLGSWHAARLADANDERGFRRHIERADQMRSETADGTGFLMRYGALQSSQVGVELASGLTILKRGDEALEVLAATPEPSDLRNRAYMLAKRAESHLVRRRPDPEAACADLAASFELGRDGGIATAISRVHQARDRFPRRYAGSACLAQLDTRLARPKV